MLGFGAAVAGTIAALLSLGFFEYLGGKRRPAGIPTSRQELKERLLGLNHPDRPFQIVLGSDTDLVVEWKLADAKWYGLLSKNCVKAWYRARLLLDETRFSVRCNEELGEITWSYGSDGLVLPRFSYTRGFFRGKMLYGRKISLAYGFKHPVYRDPTSFGEVYRYDFDLTTVRGYVEKVVEDSGWEFVTVAAKRHATYPRADDGG